MDYKRLAELLFPDVKNTIEELEALYPPRELPEGAAVTRIAPSPTGFVHFGSMFPAITSERLARQSGGVFYLRIEDTDAKREVKGAAENIIDTFAHYGIEFDEGPASGGKYGPYSQRRRKDIYRVFAKELTERGLAYPCFCSESELAAIRTAQKEEKENFGYYGKWAACRGKRLEEIEKLLSLGRPFVLRFKSDGDCSRKIKFTDLVKGELLLSENDIDHVLLKSDGIPTYHFAHAVDDHLMRTTHVVRGDEWLPTLPFHLQLFDALGFKRPKYMHISPLMKQDGQSKRKLSKRKDPEAAMSFYKSEGYPVEAVYEYVLNTLNSNFEDWRRANPSLPAREFKFSAKKMSVSGALFDINKLSDISKNIISLMDAKTVYSLVRQWAREFDKDFFALLDRDETYGTSVFSIGRGEKKPRKDLSAWKEARNYIGFLFDELFTIDEPFPENPPSKDAAEILRSFAATYDERDEQPAWFDKIKTIGEALGYAPRPADYKENPDAYKGHVGDVSMVLRVAVTGRTSSPDMYEVMRILGGQRVRDRVQRAAEKILQA